MFHVAGIAPARRRCLARRARTVTLPRVRCGVPRPSNATRSRCRCPVPTMLAALVAEQRQGAARRVVAAHARPRRLADRDRVDRGRHTQTFPGAELAQFYGATETVVDRDRACATRRRHRHAAARARAGARRRRSRGAKSCATTAQRVRARRGGRDPGARAERHGRLLEQPRGHGRSAASTAGTTPATSDCCATTDYLFVVDRLKDMIVSGGENVYSIEVEDVLYRHPAVLEAAVFGVPGRRPGAKRCTRSSCVRRAAARRGGRRWSRSSREHCRKRIAGYKVPKRIDVQARAAAEVGAGQVREARSARAVLARAHRHAEGKLDGRTQRTRYLSRACATRAKSGSARKRVDVSTHPAFAGRCAGIAGYYDWQHAARR